MLTHHIAPIALRKRECEGCEEKILTVEIPSKKYSALLTENRQCWDALIQSNENCITQLEETLKSYCDWWIFGNKKEFSDPTQRLEKTGMMDPIENTTPTDWNKFCSIFTVVFFSLSMLKRFHPQSDMMKRIALNSPNGTPDFSGYDLWLQRKAFEFCVKEKGIEFIANNLDNIRFELIMYILLKGNFEITELKMLRKTILSDNDPLTFGSEGDSVLKLIDRLVDQKA